LILILRHGEQDPLSAKRQQNYRNVLSHVPNTKVAEIARMLKAIHVQEDWKAAKASSVLGLCCDAAFESPNR
jgi:hypothetical protein